MLNARLWRKIFSSNQYHYTLVSVRGKINDLFRLENASKLTDEFLKFMANLTRTFDNFLLKLP